MHTPGPWIIHWESLLSGDTEIPFSIGTAEDSTAICETDAGCYGPKKEDALLIAAAPDLLEACRKMLNWMYLIQVNTPIDTDLEEAIHKAIAKAEGK